MGEQQDPATGLSAKVQDPEAFREAGHALIDRIADFLASFDARPVTRSAAPREIRALIDGQASLPLAGRPLGPLLAQTAELLFEHSLHNGHPRFFGYVTSSALPVGMLGDLLAAAVNPNVGLWDLAPVASEIERQCVRWLAEFIGYAPGCGGLLVSGGNVANLVGFWAARRAKTPWNIREQGLYGDPRRLVAYASEETHTWIQKAADLAGLGTDSIRWIETDVDRRMDLAKLLQRIAADRRAGDLPFLVAATAGTVSTGAVDPLPELASVCADQDLWLHVDGAYGAPAAVLPEAPAALRALALADSVALDPHKWLFSPLEAGCLLTRAPQQLLDAFSFHPAYYQLGADATDPPINFYEHGIQNSRGFRALKVWLALAHLGRDGHAELIRHDIALARRLFEAARAHPELEAVTLGLSIATFRYRPADLDPAAAGSAPYLNELNQALLVRLQRGGEAFVSNAVVDGRYLLRACIVNFRSRAQDIDQLIEAVVALGRQTHQALQRRGAPNRDGAVPPASGDL
jgi:aromatic-L-amino-acid decarboxylase